MLMKKRTIENLTWIREMRIAGGLDVGDIDAKIAKLEKELKDEQH